MNIDICVFKQGRACSTGRMVSNGVQLAQDGTQKLDMQPSARFSRGMALRPELAPYVVDFPRSEAKLDLDQDYSTCMDQQISA